MKITYPRARGVPFSTLRYKKIGGVSSTTCDYFDKLIETAEDYLNQKVH